MMVAVSGPFRDHDVVFQCPRCREALVALFDGALGCPQCEGTWIPQPIIERLFADPRWPIGPKSWWHRQLECPECASDMTATGVEGGVVDRCPGHGAWFDKGELRRELDVRSGSDHQALAQKLGGDVPDLAHWRSDELRKQRAEMARDRRALLVAERAMRERAVAVADEAAKQKVAAESKLLDERQQQKAQELADTRQRYARLDEELKRLRADVQDRQQELVTVAERIAVLRKELAELEQQV